MKKLLLFTLLVSILSINAAAGEAGIWSVNSRVDVLKGDARGVSIDDNGRLTLAPKLVEAFKTDQPYVWSSAVDNAGTVYLGTGGDGRVFKVDSSGKGALFANLDELNVSALAVGPKGEIFAATMPDGKVYQLAADGKPSIYFDPKEKYIWALAVTSDGALAVATGESGKIFKVKASGQAPESALLFDTSETHIISLAADKAGNLFAGTDASGLVLKFGADGKPFAVLDSPLREIHELAVGADGSVYALALGDSVSAAKTDAPADAKADSKVVTVEKPTLNPTDAQTKSRYDLSAAKSVVYRIGADGASDVVWNSPTISAFALAAAPGGVYVGTSDKGRIYSVTNDGRETLLLQSDEGQISTIRPVGAKFLATSSNQGKLYTFGADAAAEGTYDSPVLDAKSVASWGRLWWSGAGVTLQTRSGNTEKPNETWSAWSAPLSDAKGAPVASPRARYVQWRATLRGAASLSEVSLAFATRNVAPEVLTLQVLPTNIALVANPPLQLDPNIELSGIDPVYFGVVLPPATARRVYQKGAKSLQWTAEDRNGDKLVYDLYYKELTAPSYTLLRADLAETFFTLDGLALADGRYVFKVVAKDTAANPSGQSLSGDRTSEPFDIDNSAPVVTAVGTPAVKAGVARVSFEATESASYVERAEYSVNGGEWFPVYADDGLSDSSKERYTFDAPLRAMGPNTIAVRVFDANGNTGSARVTVNQ